MRGHEQCRYRGFRPDYFQTDSLEEVIGFLRGSDRKLACLQVMDTQLGNMLQLEFDREKKLLTIEHYSHLPETDEQKWEKPHAALREIERLVDAGKTEKAWSYLCNEGRLMVGQLEKMLKVRDARTKAAIRRFRRTLRSVCSIRCRVVGPADRADAMLDGILSAESQEDLVAAMRLRSGFE